MREDNLLCLRQRKFVVTTDSNHDRPVYPNLAREMALTGRRPVVGRRHHLHSAADRVRVSGSRSGCLLAARDRLGTGPHDGRRSAAGRVADGAGPARSHRPVWSIIPTAAAQYASKDYTDLLKEHGISISMSRKGNPYDNAACESFMKTLKYEEVYRQEYRDLAEAEALDRALPRAGLQRKAAALGAGLPPAGGVRKITCRPCIRNRQHKTEGPRNAFSQA